MKKIVCIILAIMMLGVTACSPQKNSDEAEVMFTGITLSDDGVLVHGQPASKNPSSAVYVSNDIVFYLEGQGEDYGEGKADEAHSQQEADKHTVINITQPGNYVVSGSISNGQIAVNLGKGAKKDPDAVVNITLNNANITCTVAPAIICYKAYECGDDDTDTATKEVDTSGAGFNIILADGSTNNITGSHVAKIYEPGTEDKLHKYDAAIESMVSFNIYGKDGILNLTSDNEGMETKLHMTVQGGNININSADDALNAGEDGVSVITVNGGKIVANSNAGSEGDGIDSNGWLVINDGMVTALGNRNSMDSGLDSDNGVYINGGTVFATGNMYDEISQDSRQNFAVFNFADIPASEEKIVLVSGENQDVEVLQGTAGGSIWIYSSDKLVEGDYTLYSVAEDGTRTQLAHSGMAGGFGGKPSKGGFEHMPFDGDWRDRPIPDRGTPPQDFNGEKPQQDKNKDKQFKAENMPNVPDFQSTAAQTVFTIHKGYNSFSGIAEYMAE